jgi:hypothetical protein
MVSDFAVLDSHDIDRLEVVPAMRRSTIRTERFVELPSVPHWVE